MALLDGEENLPITGRSPTYGQLDVGPVLALSAPAVGPTRWITVVGSTTTQPDGAALLWAGLRVPLEPGVAPVATASRAT